ncbi:hypothetical protein P7D22_22455, partial [Lichenihabitans sp. Uapishka_5]|uniref:hypothetical protein n=1 Tax=Lichenihabitans sp. Uapishka_5 TaxID=3037302 RepID=UPI0029EC193D|nr:hypothetical protein [Lichenihabitans sp. Uapishka_5]
MAPLLAPASSKALRHGLRFATAEPARGISKARRRWLALGGVALLGCAGFGALAPHGPPPALVSSAFPEAAAPTRPAAAQRPVTPAWVEVVRPFMAYDLAGGPFARLPLRYEARRSVAGDTREDTLAYGD